MRINYWWWLKRRRAKQSGGSGGDGGTLNFSQSENSVHIATTC